MKINKDVHGLFIRTDGQVFRPQPTPHSYPTKYTTTGTTEFENGEDVRARHISQTPFAQIIGNGKLEWWHAHGCYISDAGKYIQSKEIWNPAEATTRDKVFSELRRLALSHRVEVVTATDPTELIPARCIGESIRKAHVCDFMFTLDHTVPEEPTSFRVRRLK